MAYKLNGSYAPVRRRALPFRTRLACIVVPHAERKSSNRSTDRHQGAVEQRPWYERRLVFAQREWASSRITPGIRAAWLLTDPVGQVTSMCVARRMPDDRLERLVDCATQVFIEQGYARTQMADVAAALGVAKGTLYLYVESKEALFDLVARYADAEQPAQWPPLPVRTPKPGATVKYVRERLSQSGVPPTLARALAQKRHPDTRAELEAIMRELYDTVARNRRGIKLLDRSAREYPELAALWFEGGRGGLIGLLTEYLEDRMRRKALRSLPDPAVAARLLIETIVFWAVHRHWDPHPQTVEESVAKETVVRFVVGALVKE